MVKWLSRPQPQIAIHKPYPVRHPSLPLPFPTLSGPWSTPHVQGPQEHPPGTPTRWSAFFQSERGVLVFVAIKASNGWQHSSLFSSNWSFPLESATWVYQQVTLSTKNLLFYVTMLSIMSGCSGFIPLDILLISFQIIDRNVLPSEIQTPNYQVERVQRLVLIWRQSTIQVCTWAWNKDCRTFKSEIWSLTS